MAKIEFEIGDVVSFTDNWNMTREGRIVGTELVTDPRRQVGPHFIVETRERDVLDVHVCQVVGILTPA